MKGPIKLLSMTEIYLDQQEWNRLDDASGASLLLLSPSQPAGAAYLTVNHCLMDPRFNARRRRLETGAEIYIPSPQQQSYTVSW